jgi:hypothetical protein
MAIHGLCRPEAHLEGTSVAGLRTMAQAALEISLYGSVMAYDRYEVGSREEGLAGSTMQMYYWATHEPTIKLTDPGQVRTLDALTEAVGIPHQRGQTEIQIPEKLRNYTN